MIRESILLVGNYSNRTGYAWSNIYRLFNEIAVTFAAEGKGICVSFAKLEYPIECISSSVDYKAIQFDPYGFDARALIQYIKFIRENNVRYIYLTDFAPYHWLFALFRVIGIKRIVIHNRTSVPDHTPAQWDYTARGYAKHLLSRLSLFCADRVYAVSDFVRNRLVRKNRFLATKVVKILNGIDIKKFSPQAKTVASETIEIFVAGRASPHKGIDTLIEATALLCSMDTQYDFLIRYAGDGPDLSALKRLAVAHNVTDRFIFLGQTPSTDTLIANADIVVVPSAWGDACPSSVSEALAAGKALITTVAGGIPEMVGDDNNAILVAPKDAQALSDKLYLLITDKQLREQLGLNARLRAEQAFDGKRYHREVLNQLRSDFGI